MVWVIIAIALIFIIAPIFAVLPSARQRQQMHMRKAARAAGVTVELTTITDPNPGQDKYVSHIGQAIEPNLKVAGYRLQRKREPDWRQLPRIDWCLQRNLDQSWRWESPPPEEMNGKLLAWLNEAVEALPEDVEQVEETDYNLVVYWHERIAGRETEILDFLRQCSELPLRRPAIEKSEDTLP